MGTPQEPTMEVPCFNVDMANSILSSLQAAVIESIQSKPISGSAGDILFL